MTRIFVIFLFLSLSTVFSSAFAQTEGDLFGNTNQTTQSQPQPAQQNRQQTPPQQFDTNVKTTRAIQKPAISTYEKNKIEINKDTIGVVTGPVTGTYVRIGADLADVFDGNNMRILPIISKGSLSNLTDILFLKGVDIGIIQADALTYFRKSGEHSDIINKIKYVTKLYNEETHILARQDINSLEALKGQKVNFDKKGSGTFVTATTIFSTLKINVESTNYDQRTALEKLKAGELAAIVFVAGKPATSMETVQKDSGLRLLSIPYDDALQDIYYPSTFSSQDYPNVVQGDEKISTVATSAVMAVYDWQPGSERYNRVNRFIQALFEKFPEFQKPGRHPKWKELSLTAKVPGWERFGPAEELVASIAKEGEAAQEPASKEKTEEKKSEVSEPQATSSVQAEEQKTSEKPEKLFNEFQDWMKDNKK